MMALSLLSGSIKDCSAPDSVAKVLSMGINPVNPKPGDNSTVWINYDLSKQVTGGSIKYSYWVNFIPFTPETVDLCQQESCPLEPGVYNVSGSFIFPDVSGRVEDKIEWFDENDTPIWCVNTIYNV